MDSPGRLAQLAQDYVLEVPVFQASVNRGYDTAASLSFSIRSGDDFEDIIRAILVDEEALGVPQGIAADNYSVSPIAGRMRRLYERARILAQPTSCASPQPCAGLCRCHWHCRRLGT